MTKTISIYALQVLLGGIALAVGYAKVTGTGLMVQQFHLLGLGQGFLTIAGTAEIIAGLCLMMPRGGDSGGCVVVLRDGRRARRHHRPHGQHRRCAGRGCKLHRFRLPGRRTGRL